MVFWWLKPLRIDIPSNVFEYQNINNGNRGTACDDSHPGLTHSQEPFSLFHELQGLKAGLTSTSSGIVRPRTGEMRDPACLFTLSVALDKSSNIKVWIRSWIFGHVIDS
jgi:hypothetical protein